MMKEKREGEKKYQSDTEGRKKIKAKITKAFVRLEETNYIILQGPRDPYHAQIRFSFNVLGIFFNGLRRFKYIGRYLPLYEGFLLAMHHCSSLPQ